MDKKVAVLISGVFPAYLRRSDLQENLERIERIFSGCDFYYQTWDTKLYRHIFKNVNRDILWVKEPGTSYNPYHLARDRHPGNISAIKRLSNTPRTESQKQLVMKACFQHLGFSALYSEVPKEYDFYIRTRWDAYINEDFPMQEILKLAEKNVIGVATVPNKYYGINGGNRYERVTARRRAIKNFVDRGLYCVIQNDTDRINHTVYEKYLADFLIVFKESDYTIGYAEEMYAKQQLSGAEFGWYEMLCRHRKHVNIDGLTAIIRNTDDSLETYKKLKEMSLL